MSEDAAPKGKEDDPEVSAAAFEALERDFQEVLSNLVGDKSLERFRMEYEKLHRALKRSHDHEKKLIKKVRELNGEIVNNAAKVHTALKLSQEDQNTIATLRKEIEKAWKLVDVAHEKEARAKETITQLKDEIGNLSKLVEKGAKMSSGQETMVKELMKTREDMQRQAEEQATQAKVLENQLIELHQQREALDQENKAKVEEAKVLEEAVKARDGEVLREQRRRERLDKELRETRTKLENSSRETEMKISEVEAANHNAVELANQVKESKMTLEKYLKDYSTLATRTAKVTEEFEEAIKKNQSLHVSLNKAEKEEKARREEIMRLTTDTHTLERKFDREHREKLDVIQKLADSKTPLLALQHEKTVLEKDLEQSRREVTLLTSEKDAAGRAKQLQEKQTQKAMGQARNNSDQAKEQERIAYSLEAEVTTLKLDAKELRNIIYSVEKEREKYGIEAADQRRLYTEAMEEVKSKDVQIAELLKKILEWEKRMKAQQNMYESVRNERNSYSKTLVESQDELAEVRHKFKIMEHQTEQLKEEIGAKDAALVKESFEHQKVETKNEQQEQRISRADKLLKANEDVIHKQDAEIQRLASMIRRTDEEALTQRKEYDQVINERDILGTQLIRRNDELALLYEKLNIMAGTLRTGEGQYNARLNDIRILRIKVRDLQRELALAKSSNHGVEDVKRDLIATTRELLSEKIKVKALSGELENPLNVHRWRKLEGSDPATYEMVQKVQTLQKRLIAKTEEVVERDQLLVEKDKLYNDVKTMLARQPGTEVAEQLTVYQSNLRKKSRQLKSMASELNMYRSQSDEFKHEVERLSRELQDTKRKFYESKKRDQLMYEQSRESMEYGEENDFLNSGGSSKRLTSLGKSQAQQQLALAQSATTRYAGGGFAIK